VSKRGYAPLLIFFPLSLVGEGDTGGEGDSNYQNPKEIGLPNKNLQGVRSTPKQAISGSINNLWLLRILRI